MTSNTIESGFGRSTTPTDELWHCPACLDDLPAGLYHDLDDGWYRCSSCWAIGTRATFRRQRGAA